MKLYEYIIDLNNSNIEIKKNKYEVKETAKLYTILKDESERAFIIYR